MQDHNFVRMGDGERVLMSPGQIKEDLLAGTQDAAQRADIPALTSDELEQLFDIFADPSRIVSVSPGQEVIVTDDAVCTLFYLNIGIITAVAGSAKGIAAKWKIAELLDIEINSVNLFRSKIG